MRTVAVLCVVWASVSSAGEKLPLLLEGKLDPWGNPLDTADKLELRKLLFAKRFAELTKTVEALQAISDADCTKELVGIDAFESFDTAEPKTAKPIDAWVAAFPEHWAPVLARGLRRSKLAWDARGSALYADTSEKKLAAMREQTTAARADLLLSIERHPTLSARRAMIDLSMLDGSDDGATHFKAALKECPTTFQVRAKAMAANSPLWGGSFEAMQALAADAPASSKKLGILAGFVHGERCRTVKGAEGLTACEDALRIGPYWEWESSYAVRLIKLGRYKEALAALDLALQQRPQKARLHGMRAAALDFLMREGEANKARARAQAIDSSDFYAN